MIRQFLSLIKEARKAQDFSKAKYYTELLLDEYPNEPAVLLEKSIMLHHEKKDWQAKNILQDLLTTNKRNIALMELGKLYFDQKNYLKALDYFKMVFNESLQENNEFAFKDQFLSLQRWALCYRMLKDEENEIAAYEKLLYICLTSRYATLRQIATCKQNFGEVLFYFGYIDDAKMLFQEVLQTNIDLKYLAMIKLANILANEKKHEEALKLLEEAIKHKSIYQNNCYYAYSKLLTILKRYDEALNYCAKLEEQEPTLALESMANIYYKENKYYQALECILKANQEIPRTKNASFFKRLEMLKNVILVKIGKNIDLDLNIPKDSLTNYNSCVALAHIRRQLKKQENVQINGGLKNVFYNIDLNTADLIRSDIFDYYLVNMENVGTLNNQQTDYLFVQCDINTYNILNIKPCKNQNNQYRQPSKKTRILKID